MPTRKIAVLLCSVPLALAGCKEGATEQAAIPQSTAPRPAAPPARALSPAQFSIAGAAYVPTDEGLRLREVSRETMRAQTRMTGNRTPVLNEVIGLAPRYFPPGARVLENPNFDGVVSGAVINLNRAFANPKFWKNRSRRETILAFHALARNVAFQNEPKGAPLEVQFLLEGKRVAKIGAFATARPLQPDAILGVGGAQQRQTQQSAR